MNRRLFVLICGVAICFAGCNSKKETADPGDDQNKTTGASTGDGVTVVNPAGQNGVRSPATSSDNEKITVDTPPEMICQKFLTAVRKGDHYVWERLLTKTAHNLIRTARVEMQYPGGERATCSVAETTFNSSKKDVALVRCFVQEPVDGKTETFEFSYLLRKQQVGWRIAGIWIPLDDEGGKDFLSFENSNDVAKIKSMSGDSSPSVASDQGLSPFK